MRRLVMLFATVTWVSATRRFDRVAASSALGPSSAIHCSSQISGVKFVWYDRDLLEESRYPRRREWRMIVDKGGERRGQCLLAILRSPRAASSAARSADLDFLQPRGDAQRHPPDVLDEAQPEHRRNRPQLAHPQRRDGLILAHEQRDVVEIEVALGVRDQLDRDFVRARISGERAGRELGKLLVVALGEIRPDLPDVLLDDVEVVEQPVAGRTDVETTLGAGIQLVVDAVENIPRVLEPKQQRAYASLLLRGKKVVPARDCARSFPKPFERPALRRESGRRVLRRHRCANGRIDDSELLLEPWAGLLLPRHLLNARDVPRSIGARSAKYPGSLLGVIRLDTERHQTLADPFVLIRVLRSQRLGERVPQLLENDYQLFGGNCLLVRFARHFLQKIGSSGVGPSGRFSCSVSAVRSSFMVLSESGLTAFEQIVLPTL